MRVNGPKVEGPLLGDKIPKCHKSLSDRVGILPTGLGSFYVQLLSIMQKLKVPIPLRLFTNIAVKRFSSLYLSDDLI